MHYTRAPIWHRLLLMAMLMHRDPASVSGVEEKHHHSELSEYTDILCPYNVICREGGPKVELLQDSGRVGCCTDCSCSEDCGLRENCCFPNFDNHHLVDRSHQDCVYTATNDQAISGYHMVVDSIRNGHMVVDSFRNGSGEYCGNEEIPCGQDKGATVLGSLYPVFSNKTGRIYKNGKCARCHGLDDSDIVQWEAYLVCDVISQIDPSTIFEFLDSSSNQTMHPSCHIRFVYPGPISDITREQCYQVDEVKCTSDDDFAIIEGVNMTKQEIRNACSSNLHSPVLNGKWYKNVFCAICKSKTLYRYIPRNTCRIQEDFVFEKSVLDYPLSALIDAEKLISISRPDTHTYEQRLASSYARHDKQVACKLLENNVEDCRLVHCPSGQVRMSNGECSYPAKYWNTNNINLNLKLFPKQDVNISTISHIDFGSLLVNKSLSVSPWPKIWSVVSLMYTKRMKMDINVSIVDYFLVCMEFGKSRVTLNSFMRNVKESMNKEWVLYFNDYPVTLRQEFSEFIELFRLANSATPLTHVPGFPSPSFTQNLTVPTFLYLLNPFHRTSGISLSKMFFCEQILLKPTEYEYIDKIRLLRLNATGRFFFSGEIARAYDTTLGNVPKLCLQDAGFTWPRLANSGTTEINKKCALLFVASIVLTVLSH